MEQRIHCGGCSGVVAGSDEQGRVSAKVCPGVNLEFQETAESLERKAAPLVGAGRAREIRAGAEAEERGEEGRRIPG